MKNLILLFSIAFAFTISAQTVNYEIVKNEPIEPKISINLDLFNLDFNTGIKNIRLDNMSANIGVFGYVKIIDKLEVDFNIHKSWFTLGKLGYKNYSGNTEVNAGVNFLLNNRTRVKNVKVVLKQTKSTFADETTTTTTYIMVPTNQIKRFGVRGGLYQKTSPFNFRDYSDGSGGVIEETKYSSFGIYAGILSKTITNIIIRDDVYGKSYNSIGTSIYFDALIVPVNKFKDLNANGNVVSDIVHDYKTTFPIGFRVGLRKYHIEKKEFTGKKFGMSLTAEAGYKPYQGVFINAGIGLTLVKK